MTLIPEDPSEVPPHVLNTGEDKRRAARRAFGQAVLRTGIDDVAADQHIRRCLDVAASALYWLEDTKLEFAAHEELHKYGRYAREHLSSGCELQWTGSGYQNACPVRIAHKRIGFSIGFVGDRLCSICRQDVSECEHLPGRLYEMAGGSDDAGCCQVCGRANCDEHSTGEVYRERAHVLVTNATIHEVSLVSKPKQPDARLMAVPVDSDRLTASLGPGFKFGMRVSCDFCQLPCPGMEPFGRDIRHGDAPHAVDDRHRDETED